MISAGVAYGLAAATAAALFITGAAVAETPEVNQADDTAPTIIASAAVETRATVDPTVPPPTVATTVPPPMPVVIPALGGVSPAEATRTLRALELEFTRSETPAFFAYAIGVVVATKPPEGTAVFPGDSVDLVIGRRPEAAYVMRGRPSSWGSVDWVDSVDTTVGRCSVGTVVEGGAGLRLDNADCAEPHDYQFLAEVNSAELFDSRDAAADALRSDCKNAFEGFVGAPLAGSDLVIMLVLNWDSGVPGASGECLIAHGDQERLLVGDAAGSLW